MVYALLVAAIGLEVVGTMCLKWTEGFSRLIPSGAVVLCYAGAFYLLGQVLQRGVPVAVAYAVWSAAGIVAITLAGVVVLGEHLGRLQVVGIALVVAGVVAMQLGTIAHRY